MLGKELSESNQLKRHFGSEINVYSTQALTSLFTFVLETN